MNDNEMPKIATEISEVREADVYHVEIKPEDWYQNGTIWEAEITCVGLYKNGITHAYPDEEKMKENCKSKTKIYKLINDIFEKEILEIKTDTYKLICQFIGNKPDETIYLDIEQLPFPDCPLSKLEDAAKKQEEEANTTE